MPKPIVALVGRPNVGKSTLFNRLAGEPLAIVDETPGTTRDRLFASSEWNGRGFDIIDTGGIDPSRSSAGREPLSIGSAEFIEEIRSQAAVAIQEADAVLFLVDGIAGITPADSEVAEFLRKRQKKVDGKLMPPVFLVVNKVDEPDRTDQLGDFYALGIGEPFAVSAIHGTGTGDLLDELVKSLPPAEEQEEDDSIKIAIVGKPNTGKSSLLNRLAGEERSIVSPIPGTTRDSVDTRITVEGLPVTLIDTAGIRKRGKIIPGVEKYSVIRSMRAIERADVALLMIDATEGISAQDTHIAGYILEAWKSVVVVVNKWDAIEKESQTMQAYTEHIRKELNFMAYVPILFISAKTGQRVEDVLPLALQVQEERLVRVQTSAINHLLHNAQDQHTPIYKSGEGLRLFYGTQVHTNPPTFMIYVNNPKLAHFSYLRFLENQIRKEFPYTGTPIRIVLKPRHD